MKKIIRGLLAAILVSSSAYGVTSNMTYMTARDALSNNSVMGSSVQAKCKKSSGMGADISVSGFFRRSHNEGDLAKYFGGGQAADADQDGTLVVAAGSVDYMTAAAEGMSGTVNYSPRREEYGAHVAWNQCLGKWVKGLSLSVDAPITHVTTDMRATYSPSTANTGADATEGIDKTLADFFSGGDLGITSPFTQSALTKAKISATKLGVTGVADVSARLGYSLVSEKDYSVGGSLNFRIPTGNKVTGATVFEPTYGGRQFGLGAGLNSSFNLWRSENGKSGLALNLGADYEYQFSAEETRTRGLYDYTNTLMVSGGQYFTVANEGSLVLAPLANVSTAVHNVEPGSRLNATAGFAYNCNRLSVDVSYNLFYAQEESCTVKTAWTNDQYGIPTAALTGAGDGDAGELAGATFSITTAGDVATGSIDKQGDTTTARYFVSSAAATTPAQVTHKVAGSVGYSFDLKTPIRIGAGASGEFNSNNASVNSWDVWAKVGICF